MVCSRGKKGSGRRTQLLDDLRNRRRYWKLKEEAKTEQDGNYNLFRERKEDIHVIFYKSMDLLISCILDNNNHGFN